MSQPVALENEPKLTVPGMPAWIVPLVFRLHDAVRNVVRQQLVAAQPDDLRAIAHPGAGDVSFGIDVPAEMILEQVLALAPEPIVVVAEGFGTRVFPPGSSAADARLRLIVDPLDGSRELMYQKRSAYVLSGVALERGDATNLGDIAFGVLTEVPPMVQSMGVRAWAIRGLGAFERLWDLGTLAPVGPERQLRSSNAPTIKGGFATFTHYFPGTHAPMGILADEVLQSVLGPVVQGEAAAFDDCYLSTGGQLYLLASGRYRLVVDARPLLGRSNSGRTRTPLCAHPYDLAGGLLIAEEAGATIVDLDGEPLRYPLDTDTDCGFVGYANDAIRSEVWPSLRASLSGLSTASA
ncbi:MAG: inositol monophosphatase family protein [Solirubrobacterales bacterium]